MTEEFERDHSLNLYQRLNLVMGEVGRIEPDRELSFGRGPAVPYVSHDAVAGAIQPLFVKHGIGIRPTVTNHVKDGNRTELTVDVSFVNIDKTEDRETYTAIGYGVDTSDKGPGKALSYAVKAACLKALMINSSEDEGGEAVEHDPDTARESDVETADNARKAALEAAATTYKSGIDGAGSTKELRDLKAGNSVWLEAAPEVTQNFFNNLFRERMAELKESEKGNEE